MMVRDSGEKKTCGEAVMVTRRRGMVWEQRDYDEKKRCLRCQSKRFRNI